jgi:hypothetical protein
VSDTLKAVYDCRDGSFPFDGATAICDWAVREGFDLRDAYRMEIRLLDTPFARVFEYDKDAQGGRFLDPATDDIAKRRPYDVVISSMPPIPPAGHHETGDTP